MTFWVLRHVASGLLMPQMKRGRGYSHWNPGSEVYQKQSVFAELPTPRLLKSEKQARRCIREWVRFPNLKVRFDSDGWEDWQDKPDGRQLSDLEVVEVQLTGV